MITKIKQHFKPIYGVILLSVIICLGIAMEREFRPDNTPEPPPVGFADPSAIYCGDLGYDYQIVDTEDGQTGVCNFPDGTQCPAWDFLNGTCGAEFSICTQSDMTQEVRHDGQNAYAMDYAVCVDQAGAEVAPVTEIAKLQEKATEGCKSPPVSSTLGQSETYNGEMLAMSLPKYYDWRNRLGKNFMTGIRDQGGCGSCWAFSALGTIEAALNRANNSAGNNFDLSEQFFVSDCLSGSSCCGGQHYSVFAMTKSLGAPDEGCMNYVDGNYSTGCSCNGTCSANCTYNTGGSCSDRSCGDRCGDWWNRIVTLNAYGKVSKDTSTIKQSIVNKGPVGAYINMSGDFSTGVYRCGVDYPINHAVVLVGWDDFRKAWIVRNSWGSTWGPDGNGYFYVGYKECGIQDYVYYATINGFKYPITATNPSTAGLWSINGGWYLSGNRSSIYTNGVDYSFGSIAYAGIFTNGNYSVKMKRSGVCAGCANSIFIRGDTSSLSPSGDWYNSYSFQYTNSGYFSIWQNINGSPSPLVSWTKSSAIHKGGWNTLKINSNNSDYIMKFFINGVLVAKGNISTLPNGKVGIGYYRDSGPDTLYVDSANLIVPKPTFGASVPAAETQDSILEVHGQTVEGGTIYQSP